MNIPRSAVAAASIAATTLALSALPTVATAGAESPASTVSCRWRVAPGPALPGSSILYGVRAIAADDIWAVGSQGDVTSPDSLAEHWDGTSWTVVNTPNPTRAVNDGNVLDAVSATSPDDVWAVGSHIRRGGISTLPFILHFDGDRWRQVPSPPGRFLDSSLTGVAAIAPDDAWIVGSRAVGSPPQDAPLALHWDGSAWSVVRTPNPPGDREDTLQAVSAVASDDVWAVGMAGERTTMTMHFDGTRWRIVKSPNPPGDARNSLNGVVATAADDVWAVGTGASPNSGISEHWDGTSWSLVPMQRKGEFEELAGVTTQADGSVWAVGLVRPKTPAYQTLAQRYDGTTWQVVRTPSLDRGDQLESVTTAGTDVWAVGVTAAGPDFLPGKALILRGC